MLGLTVPKPRLDFWPESTTVSDTDIVVAGISLRQLAEVCNTPAVHSAALVMPGSGQRPDVDATTAVLVTRVLTVAEHRSGVPVIQVDARLDNLRLVWSETRLIGARPGSRSRISLLVRTPGTAEMETTDDVLVVELPGRVVVGDLIAIPSRSIPAGFSHLLHPLTGRADWRPNSVFENAAPPNDGVTGGHLDAGGSLLG
jgi:hypothetical protein